MKQSKDYRYAREAYIFYTLPVSIFCLILQILRQIIFNTKPSDRIRIFDWEMIIIGWLVTAIFICIALYSYSYRQKRKKFLASNLFYPGTVIKYDSVYKTRGTGSRFYCYIQFQRNGKLETLRTKGYTNSPYEKLANPNCTVYELHGEFYPANFTIRSRKQPYIHIPECSNDPMHPFRKDKS
ncbi:MAG: hypothetical protein PUC65_10680 [Clostridiales bacterium]|nr:hypothetical protein [Clostridiales bacterium]